MMRKFCKLLSILPLLITPGMAQAINIGFNPASQSVETGDTVMTDVVISDLGAGAAPSISTYDLDITFDDSHLSFVSTSFGNQLDIFGLGSITSSTETSPGVLNLFELSFDLPADLNDFQSDSFTLATITFDTLFEGTSNLNIMINALGDAEGNPLAADLSRGSTTITNPVPIPASGWLMFSVLVFLIPFSKNNLKQV